jgi:thiol:disulfide interchange protein DsbD
MLRAKLLLVPFAYVIAILSPALADEAPETQDPLVVSGKVTPYVLGPGQSGRLHLDLQLPAHLHAYVDKFKLVFEAPENTIVGRSEIAPQVEFYDKFSKSTRQGVTGVSTQDLSFELAPLVPESQRDLEIHLVYQACSETYCLFPKTKILRIPFQMKKAAGVSSPAASFWQRFLHLGH